MDKGGGFSFLPPPPSSSFIIFALVLQLSQTNSCGIACYEANYR